MGLFQEYMNAKGTVKNPVVDISGGDPDPKTPPNKPPKEHGGKPYANSDGKGPKNKNKGFGDQGDQSLKYDPSDDPSSKGHPPAKIPTVEQVEIASYVAESVSKDTSLIENLVRQFKVRGLMGPLVAEMLQHKDAYKHISELMGHEEHGMSICKSLVRSMLEEVAPPFSDQMDLEDEDEQEIAAANGDTQDESGIEDAIPDVEAQAPGAPAIPDPLMQQTPAMKNFCRAMMSKR